jgi:hypothetical protein
MQTFHQAVRHLVDGARRVVDRLRAGFDPRAVGRVVTLNGPGEGRIAVRCCESSSCSSRASSARSRSCTAISCRTRRVFSSSSACVASSASLRSVMSCTVPTTRIGIPCSPILDLTEAMHPAHGAITRPDDPVLAVERTMLAEYLLRIGQHRLTIGRMQQPRPALGGMFIVAVDAKDAVEHRAACPDF